MDGENLLRLWGKNAWSAMTTSPAGQDVFWWDWKQERLPALPGPDMSSIMGPTIWSSIHTKFGQEELWHKVLYLPNQGVLTVIKHVFLIS